MPALYPVMVGFVPLVDAALLVIAREEGFAAARGIDLTLVKAASWAAIRDRLAVGHVDAAHMLAPAAIAMHLGLDQPCVPLSAPLALSRDGNAITLSQALARSLVAELGGEPKAVSPAESAQALARIIAHRRALGQPPLTVGSVFGYSCHTYQLGRWLESGGLALGRDVQLVVVPPPQMVEAVRAGTVDLFCAGSPWNSLAVAAGVGRILHPCAAIVPDTLEKILVMPAAHAEARWVTPLLEALRQAARFTEQPENRPRIAALLAQPAYLGVPAALIEAVLAGTTATLSGADPIRWIGLDHAAISLDAAQFEPLLRLMSDAGHLPDADAARQSVVAMVQPPPASAVA